MHLSVVSDRSRDSINLWFQSKRRATENNRIKTPLHSKVTEYQKLGLFVGLRHLTELEGRIEALSNEQQRGDAFEVFTEAYLATQRPHDAHTLWPQSTSPAAVLQSLGLTVRDNGVDRVRQSPVSLLSVYQAKFRSGRAPLTWRELSTFIGLADSSQIHTRILFTNSEDIPTLMNERRGFFCIRGADLERLEEMDFVAIERWLAGAPVDVPKKEPLSHQQEAIAEILPALEQPTDVARMVARNSLAEPRLFVRLLRSDGDLRRRFAVSDAD